MKTDGEWMRKETKDRLVSRHVKKRRKKKRI